MSISYQQSNDIKAKRCHPETALCKQRRTDEAVWGRHGLRSTEISEATCDGVGSAASPLRAGRRFLSVCSIVLHGRFILSLTRLRMKTSACQWVAVEACGSVTRMLGFARYSLSPFSPAASPRPDFTFVPPQCCASLSLRSCSCEVSSGAGCPLCCGRHLRLCLSPAWGLTMPCAPPRHSTVRLHGLLCPQRWREDGSHLPACPQPGLVSAQAPVTPGSSHVAP